MGFQQWSGSLHCCKFYPVPVHIHIKSRNPQGSQQSLSLAIAHVRRQENKTKQKNVQHEITETMLNLIERKKQQMEKHCVTSSPAETSTVWRLCCWVWYSPTHSVFPCVCLLGSLAQVLTKFELLYLVNQPPISLAGEQRGDYDSTCWPYLCVACMYNKWLYCNSKNHQWTNTQRCGKFYLAWVNNKPQNFVSLFQHQIPPFLAIRPSLISFNAENNHHGLIEPMIQLEKLKIPV